MTKSIYNCKRCNVAPIRKDEDLDTWLECPKCGDHSPVRHNRMSDDYAFYNSEGAWNRHVLHWQPLIQRDPVEQEGK